MAGAGGGSTVHQGWQEVHHGSVCQWLQAGERDQQGHQPEGAHHQWKDGGHQHLSLGRGQP